GAVAVVAGGEFLGHLARTHFLQAIGAAEAVEGVTFVQQLADFAGVQLAALALPVGPVGTADVRPFAPGQAQPVEGVEDVALGLGGAAGLVSVLDAQDELAPVLMREAAIEQRDVGGADVGISGGGWGDAGSDLLHGLPADDVNGLESDDYTSIAIATDSRPGPCGVSAPSHRL